MRRADLTELHYITAIENMPSILSLGLLSHQQASRVRHKSVAMQEIQERRDGKLIELTGRELHEYVNLYFHARNPMMYKRKGLHQQICVVRISTDVLIVPGTVIADQNASSGYARFYPSPAGLAFLDKGLVFAADWRHPNDRKAYLSHKAIKCAEVLVPDIVRPEYIVGAYVSCSTSRDALIDVAPMLHTVVDGDLFFQIGRVV